LFKTLCFFFQSACFFILTLSGFNYSGATTISLNSILSTPIYISIFAGIGANLLTNIFARAFNFYGDDAYNRRIESIKGAFKKEVHESPLIKSIHPMMPKIPAINFERLQQEGRLEKEKESPRYLNNYVSESNIPKVSVGHTENRPLKSSETRKEKGKGKEKEKEQEKIVEVKSGQSNYVLKCIGIGVTVTLTLAIIVVDYILLAQLAGNYGSSDYYEIYAFMIVMYLANVILTTLFLNVVSAFLLNCIKNKNYLELILYKRLLLCLFVPPQTVALSNAVFIASDV